MASDIDICANALVKLGEEPIQSFVDGTDAAIVCSQRYPLFRLGLLSMYEWRFTMTRASLTDPDAETPSAEWTYRHALPGDLLVGPINVRRSPLRLSPLITDWEAFGGGLFSHEPALYIEYQRDVDETSWPAYFVHFVVTAFASEIANALTDSQTTSDSMSFAAWGMPSENRQGGLFRVAKLQDARSRITRSFFSTGDPLTRARFA